MLFPGYHTNYRLHSYLLRQTVTAKKKKIQLKNVLHHHTYKQINTKSDYGKISWVHTAAASCLPVKAC